MGILRSGAWVLLVVSGGSIACGTSDIRPAVVQGIQERVTAGQPGGRNAEVWQDVSHFYEQRAYEPAWVLEGGHAPEAVALLSRATEHGFSPDAYLHTSMTNAVNALKDKDVSKDVGTLAELDVVLTTALLHLGQDVALGRLKPGTMDPRWKAMREAPDLPGTLAQALTTNLAGWLDSVRPKHPEYAALQKVLAGGATADHDRIAINMERWRWLPDDLGDRHLLVNIPALHMAAREHGQSVLDMKVIVGSVEHETPIFSGDMNTVVFSPYWNVPDSIAEGETAPAAARDPAYLSRNNIDILRVSKGGVQTVNPSEVDWDDVDALKGLSFRQRPGADNALGHVKFLFPNKYDVYLHDTPADALFARQGRALSHGCIRLEQPEKLAEYVLRDRPEWDTKSIETAMYSGTEKHVKLEASIPVHLVYFTVWPNEQGGVDSWPDVYGFDRKQLGSGL
ncbi:MAG: L,D-transpeptidase family protein [Acidobacteria bacterium]|nr:L,D-transpeptidase family protein [Acidobacteriota bacterium]